MSARSRRQRTASLLLWLVIAVCPLRFAFAGEKIAFDIPAGPALKTLEAYHKISGIQNFVYPYARVRGIYTNEVRGNFDAVEALRKMLEGTRLQFDFNSDDSITISVMARRSSGALRSTCAMTSRSRVARVSGAAVTSSGHASSAGSSSTSASADSVCRFKRKCSKGTDIA